MNERIKELMDQSRDYYSNGYVDCPEFNPEKFARLLLKTVLTIVESNTPDPDPYSENYDTRIAGKHVGNFIRDEIKREFGLER